MVKISINFPRKYIFHEHKATLTLYWMDIFGQEPITRGEQLPYFTDQFIFRHILGHFFPRKQNLHHVSERIRSIIYQKGKP